MYRSQTPAPERSHHTGFVLKDRQNATQHPGRTYGVGPLPAVPSRPAHRMKGPSLEPERLVRRGAEPFLHARTGQAKSCIFIDSKRSSYLEVHHDNPFPAAVESAIVAAVKTRTESTSRQILTRNETTR